MDHTYAIQGKPYPLQEFDAEKLKDLTLHLAFESIIISLYISSYIS